MPASWVAASVRARLLANRRIGSARAREIARSAGVGAALELLFRSPYGADLEPGMSLAEAQRQVAATVLWNVRMIAGWLPPGGVQIVQPLAAWFELANVEERLAFLGGGVQPSPYQLGRLAVAWPAVSRATTPDAVRAALAGSRWGDPGQAAPEAIMLALRFRWAAWVATSVPGAGGWAASASALFAARLRFSLEGGGAGLAQVHAYGVPSGWGRAATPAELGALLPRQTAWVLDGVESPADLWRAEARWWARLKREAAEMLVRSRFAPAAVVGAAGLLAHDAWLTRAALAAAARGAAGGMVFDAVA